MPARPTLLPFGSLVRPAATAEAPPARAFLRSVGPALDSAFGLEDASSLPDEIAALLDRLRAGPLGAVPETGRGLLREAVPEPA